MQRIAVIIPFYQCQPGLLRGAVQSIVRQTEKEDLGIIIVDDGSPVSAKTEIGDLLEASPVPIKVIVQDNRGVSAARNTALGSLDDSYDAVAFLDSDDEWLPDHIKKMQSAFRAGADFYFTNYSRPGAAETAFASARAFAEPLAQHGETKCLSFFWYTGSLLELVVTDCPIPTPTVGYRRSRDTAGLRFNRNLARAGEDMLFWAALSRYVRRVAISWESDMVCGAGVSINAGTRWGEEATLERIYDLAWSRAALQMFLDGQLSALNRQHLAAIDDDFLVNLFGCFRRGKLPLALLARYLGIRPLSLTRFWPVLIKIFDRRRASRPGFFKEASRMDRLPHE